MGIRNSLIRHAVSSTMAEIPFSTNLTNITNDIPGT